MVRRGPPPEAGRGRRSPARTVKMEMDFRLEAAAASEFAESTAQDKDFRISGIYWDRTTKEVLTLEWIDGTPLSDIKALASKGYDLQDLGRNVVQSFLRTAMRDGFFHADMHQGNLFVDAQEGASLWWTSASWYVLPRFQGAALSRGNPLWLHQARLPARGGGPFRGRLCAARAQGRGFRAGHWARSPASRFIPAPPIKFPWRNC